MRVKKKAIAQITQNRLKKTSPKKNRKVIINFVRVYLSKMRMKLTLVIQGMFLLVNRMMN